MAVPWHQHPPARPAPSLATAQARPGPRRAWGSPLPVSFCPLSRARGRQGVWQNPIPASYLTDLPMPAPGPPLPSCHGPALAAIHSDSPSQKRSQRPALQRPPPRLRLRLRRALGLAASGFWGPPGSPFRPHIPVLLGKASCLVPPSLRIHGAPTVCREVSGSWKTSRTRHLPARGAGRGAADLVPGPGDAEPEGQWPGAAN